MTVAGKTLIDSLFVEMFQTEQSAQEHCRREASRLAGGPRDAMDAVSRHAEAFLARLEGLAEARGMSRKKVGIGLGHLFSQVREHFADRLISAEFSYRGTLMGMQHGDDLFRLTFEAAKAHGDSALEAFAGEWLATREPLLAEARAQLAWFAHHPQEALVRAHR